MGSPYVWFFFAFCVAGSAVVMTPMAIPVVIVLGLILMLLGYTEGNNTGGD